MQHCAHCHAQSPVQLMDAHSRVRGSQGSVLCSTSSPVGPGYRVPAGHSRHILLSPGICYSRGAEKGTQCLHYGILPNLHPISMQLLGLALHSPFPHFSLCTGKGYTSHCLEQCWPQPQWSPRWGCSIPSTHKNASCPSGELCHPSIAAKGNQLMQQIQ